MKLSLWPTGVQQDLPMHQCWLGRQCASGSYRKLISDRTPPVFRQARCLAQTQHVSSPTATDPASASPSVSSNGHAPVQQSKAYPFQDIEQKWQRHWKQHKTFATPDIDSLDTSKPKFYALDMYAPLQFKSDRTFLHKSVLQLGSQASHETTTMYQYIPPLWHKHQAGITCVQVSIPFRSWSSCWPSR